MYRKNYFLSWIAYQFSMCIAGYQRRGKALALDCIIFLALILSSQCRHGFSLFFDKAFSTLKLIFGFSLGGFLPLYLLGRREPTLRNITQHRMLCVKFTLRSLRIRYFPCYVLNMHSACFSRIFNKSDTQKNRIAFRLLLSLCVFSSFFGVKT